jgi:hypothetical protein
VPRCGAITAFHRSWLPGAMGRQGERNSPRGSSADRELQSRTRGGEAQASTFGDSGGELQGTAHDEVGQNGCGKVRRSLGSG